jgi:hypothetical protein
MPAAAGPPTEPALTRDGELAINLSPKRVDYRYLYVLIVGAAVVTKVRRKLFAVLDGPPACLESRS